MVLQRLTTGILRLPKLKVSCKTVGVRVAGSIPVTAQ